MAMKQIVVTVSGSRPCRFDGSVLQIRNDPSSLPPRLLADLLQGLIVRLCNDEVLKSCIEPMVKMALHRDHYDISIVLEVDDATHDWAAIIRCYIDGIRGGDQIGFFEDSDNNLEVEIGGEVMSAINDASVAARQALGGTVLSEEVSVFVDGDPVGVLTGKIQKPPKVIPVPRPNQILRVGMLSGYCTVSRLIHFFEEEGGKSMDVKYDPSMFHEQVNGICFDPYNRVQILTKEIVTGHKLLAEILVSIKILEKSQKNLF